MLSTATCLIGPTVQEHHIHTIKHSSPAIESHLQHLLDDSVGAATTLSQLGVAGVAQIQACLLQPGCQVASVTASMHVQKLDSIAQASRDALYRSHHVAQPQHLQRMAKHTIPAEG